MREMNPRRYEGLTALDFGAIVAFISVMETGSLEKTACALGYSRSAISLQLKRLRKQFACPLFVREGRSLEPTAEARALYVTLVSMMDTLSGATKDIREA